MPSMFYCVILHMHFVCPMVTNNLRMGASREEIAAAAAEANANFEFSRQQVADLEEDAKVSMLFALD